MREVLSMGKAAEIFSSAASPAPGAVFGVLSPLFGSSRTFFLRLFVERFVEDFSAVLAAVEVEDRPAVVNEVGVFFSTIWARHGTNLLVPFIL